MNDARSDWLHARADESREMVKQVAGRYRIPKKVILASDLAELDHESDDIVSDDNDMPVWTGVMR
jgi:hypothetical protein